MKRKTTRLLIILALVFTLILPSFSVGATPPVVADEVFDTVEDMQAAASMIVADEVFDTVEDMKAASLTVGTVVETLGFYEEGDGGGAYYDVLPSGVANGYFSFEAANHTIAKLRVLNDTVNIRQVGAKGDEMTDDTVAINAATMSEYGTVYAPVGTYLVSPRTHPNEQHRKAVIVLGKRDKLGINLYGEGMNLTVFKVAAGSAKTTVSEDGSITYNNYDSVICGWNPYLSGVTLSDFTIDQNVPNNDTVPMEGGAGAANHNKLYCIRATLEGVHIYNIKFKHQGSNAIYANNTNSKGIGYEIDNCEFEFDMHRNTITNYDNSALYCVGSNFQVHHNTITTKLDFDTEINDIKGYTSQLYGTGGIEIHGGGADVFNNTIEKYYVGIHYQAREGYNNLGSQVHDNLISQTQRGLSFGHDGSITELSGARCHDNDIRISFAYKKGFRDADPEPCGFRVSTTGLEMENVRIEDNTITYDRSTLIPGHTYHFDYHAGIYLLGSRSENIRILGNTIEDAPGLGILLNRNNNNIIARDFVVENNQFKNCGWSTDLGNSSIGNTIGRRAAITVYPSGGDIGDVSDIIIKDNTFKDTSSNGECLYSINAPKSLVTNGKIVLQNNIEESVSGKGFYTPQFEELTQQVYPRIPTELDVNSFPMDGAFYKGQMIRVKDGEEVVSTWFIKRSGVIGKEIPTGSETGTIVDGRSIRMENTGHGIQSGDIINIRTADGQEQTNVWVGGVTGTILYTQQLNLTGEVTVSYFRAGYIEENGTVVFSAIPEKPSVIRNETFYVTVKTHKDVQNVKVTSESGSVLGIHEASSFLSGDHKIWTIKIAVGTAGARELKVYGTFDNVKYEDAFAILPIEVVAGTPPSSGPRAVISVTPEVSEVLINEHFYINVVTHKDVQNIKISNENGLDMAIWSKTSVISGSHKIWRIRIVIGTAGENRVMRAHGTFDNVNYNEYAEFTINVSGRSILSADDIISATAPASSPANTSFTVTVVTSLDVAYIRIVNETGGEIVHSLGSVVTSGDTKTWTVSIRVGTKGNRTITALGAGSIGGFTTTGKSFNITIV